MESAMQRKQRTVPPMVVVNVLRNDPETRPCGAHEIDCTVPEDKAVLCAVANKGLRFVRYRTDKKRLCL